MNDDLQASWWGERQEEEPLPEEINEQVPIGGYGVEREEEEL